MSFLPSPFKFVLNFERYQNVWYVYTISTLNGPTVKIYYVGVTDDRHLMTLQDAMISPTVRKHLTECGMAVIDVLSSHHTQADAKKAAFPIISANRPTGNQYGMAEKPRKKRVKCIETGDIFDSVSAAAQFAGVAPPAMSAHLYRRKGYAHVRKYTFEFAQ